MRQILRAVTGPTSSKSRVEVDASDLRYFSASTSWYDHLKMAPCWERPAKCYPLHRPCVLWAGMLGASRVVRCTLRRRCGTFFGMHTGMLPLATDSGTMEMFLLLPAAACCLLPHHPPPAHQLRICGNCISGHQQHQVSSPSWERPRARLSLDRKSFCWDFQPRSSRHPSRLREGAVTWWGPRRSASARWRWGWAAWRCPRPPPGAPGRHVPGSAAAPARRARSGSPRPWGRPPSPAPRATQQDLRANATNSCLQNVTFK